MQGTCAIDFGTSNSAIALPGTAVPLVPVEGPHSTMPTAVFYAVEGLAPHEPPRRLYGRAAVAAYVEGVEGRLMRSMKSILGSTLAEASTDVGAGRSVAYLDVVSGTLAHLKARAEQAAGAPLTRAVIGRPVYFVDDDPERDARAQAALDAAARRAGFAQVQFVFEPLAAAMDHEAGLTQEALVLVADLGGGTCDFSVLRLGPARRAQADRRGDILAHHGIHVAGTDFDRHLCLAHLLPTCGHRTHGPDGREVPSRIFHDLATWHLINTCYSPGRLAEAQRLKVNFAEPRLHARLMQVLRERLGHGLAALAEQAKIAVARGGHTQVLLHDIEPGLAVALDAAQAGQALGADVARIVAAVRQTLGMAGVAPDAVQSVYFTGGSTGLAALTQAIAACCPQARAVQGDPLASVARGLGLVAARL